VTEEEGDCREERRGMEGGEEGELGEEGGVGVRRE
jgi:hypothetical protein